MCLFWGHASSGKHRTSNNGTKVHCLQRALRACGATIAEDGKLGDATLAAVAIAPPEALLPALREALAGHYRLIAARNSSAQRYLAGWLARAYS